MGDTRETAGERLEAAIGLLKDWQGNDDITAPIERICEVVEAFDAWKASEADPPDPDREPLTEAPTHPPRTYEEALRAICHGATVGVGAEALADVARAALDASGLAPLTEAEARMLAPILAAQRTPWPIYGVLVKLADAADVLLGRYSCDLHGYETVMGARDSARAIVAATGRDPGDFTDRFGASARASRLSTSLRGAADRLARALGVDAYTGSIEGPGAAEVVAAHRALCMALYGELHPPVTQATLLATSRGDIPDAVRAESTPEEQDLVIAAIPLQAGLTRDGERVTTPAAWCAVCGCIAARWTVYAPEGMPSVRRFVVDCHGDTDTRDVQPEDRTLASDPEGLTPSLAEPAKDTPPPFHAVWPMYDDGPER